MAAWAPGGSASGLFPDRRRASPSSRHTTFVGVRTELLNGQRWRTRLELANALFEYLEIFHNRRSRHSSLGMLTGDSVAG